MGQRDGESTCKRGSVHLRSEGWAAIHLSDLPRKCLCYKARGPPSMFDLAPGGVCQATLIAQGAGALLPHRFTLTCTWLPKPLAVCFLWHFPARHRDSRFVSTLPFGAPTFLATCCQAARPPSRLTIHFQSDTTFEIHQATTVGRVRAVASPRGE